MSANQLKRMLRINYRTAWYLCHRIRFAMAEANPEKLDGVVEMDETYIGGRRRGKGNKVKGRGTDKPVVIGIRERGGNLRFFHAQDANTGTLATYIKEHISDDVDVIVTDEYPPYKKAILDASPNAKH
jgi:hypothetical protein